MTTTEDIKTKIKQHLQPHIEIAKEVIGKDTAEAIKSGARSLSQATSKVASDISRRIEEDRKRRTSPEYLAQKEAEAQRKHELKMAQIEAESERRRYSEDYYRPSYHRYNYEDDEDSDFLDIFSGSHKYYEDRPKRYKKPGSGLESLTGFDKRSLPNVRSRDPVGDMSFLSRTPKSKTKIIKRKQNDPLGLGGYF